MTQNLYFMLKITLFQKNFIIKISLNYLISQLYNFYYYYYKIGKIKTKGKFPFLAIRSANPKTKLLLSYKKLSFKYLLFLLCINYL